MIHVDRDSWQHWLYWYPDASSSLMWCSPRARLSAPHLRTTCDISCHGVCHDKTSIDKECSKYVWCLQEERENSPTKTCDGPLTFCASFVIAASCGSTFIHQAQPTVEGRRRSFRTAQCGLKRQIDGNGDQINFQLQEGPEEAPKQNLP